MYNYLTEMKAFALQTLEDVGNKDMTLSDAEREIIESDEGVYVSHTEAKEHVSENMFMFINACIDTDIDAENLKEVMLNKDWQYMDAMIRHNVLMYLIEDVYDKYMEQYQDEEEE